jgi:catalase
MLKHNLAATLAVFALVSPAVAWAEDEPLPVQIVDAMNKAFGTHPGFRANHAKGVVVEGSFKASPEAPALSKAKLFDGSTIPATVRFSDSTGVPNLPDGSALANPHGMAIKFHLPNGEEVDRVTNSLKFFPVSNGADFRDLFLAVAASPPDAPKPTRFEQFAAAHPTVAAAAATVAPAVTKLRACGAPRSFQRRSQGIGPGMTQASCIAGSRRASFLDRAGWSLRG